MGRPVAPAKSLSPSAAHAGRTASMSLLLLFLAALIVGLSAVNAALPAAAWGRTRDPRFLLVVGANLCLAGLGILWTWGQLPLSPPADAGTSLSAVALVTAAAIFLLGIGLLPRRA